MKTLRLFTTLIIASLTLQQVSAQVIGSDFEPINLNYMPEGSPRDQWLDKTDGTISYRQRHIIDHELFMFAVHPSGDPTEDSVTGGIQNLARDLQTKNVPSVLLDRYPNRLNRNYFALEVNDHMSGGGYHSLALSTPEPRIIITGAFLDGCISNALSHFIAQMEMSNQRKMIVYVVKELTNPFCEIGYEQNQRLQEPVDNLSQCLMTELVRGFGVNPFLDRMISSFADRVERLRTNYVSETLIPSELRPVTENDIGFTIHTSGETRVIRNGSRRVEVHFINKNQLMTELGI